MQHLSETQTLRAFSQPQEEFSKPNNNEGRTIMKRDILEKQFNPEQIKQREGNFGKMLDYIEGHVVIQRLNDAFESNWSFSVTEHNILEKTGEVLVVGQITAGNIVKTQFGSSRITRNRETNEMVSLASDLKAAATDALKKCATLLGVGLHLYNRNNDNVSSSNDNGQPQNNVTYGAFNNDSANSSYCNGNEQQYQNNGNGNGSNGNSRLSDKQYKYIMSLINNQGRSTTEIDGFCIETYGASIEHLSRVDASSLIDSLLSMADCNQD